MSSKTRKDKEYTDAKLFKDLKPGDSIWIYEQTRFNSYIGEATVIKVAAGKAVGTSAEPTITTVLGGQERPYSIDEVVGVYYNKKGKTGAYLCPTTATIRMYGFNKEGMKLIIATSEELFIAARKYYNV